MLVLGMFIDVVSNVGLYHKMFENSRFCIVVKVIENAKCAILHYKLKSKKLSWHNKFIL